jgi:hypothetical protein
MSQQPEYSLAYNFGVEQVLGGVFARYSIYIRYVKCTH